MVGLWLTAALGGRYAMDHNHPDLRWSTLQTEHFDIHFPVSRHDREHDRWVSGEGTARRLARVADDTWLRLATEIGYFPSERVDVVILEDTDRLRGFTLTEQDWIVFSGNPGPELARMRGRVDWVEDLLAHELAHVFTLKKAGWVAEAAGSFGVETGSLVEEGPNQLGIQVDLSDSIPHWWSEGSAEFWSERIGVNWWTPSRELTLRASVMDDRLLASEEWGTESLLDDWYDGERAYQQGYAFHRWFAARYGDEAWREVMERSGKRFRLDWSRVFVEVTDKTLDQLQLEFETDLRAEVASQIAGVDAAGRVEGRELALWELGWDTQDPWTQDRWLAKDGRDREDRRESSGTLNLHGTYSADGKWFARHRAGWTEVRAVDEGMWSVFAGEVPDWSKTRDQRDRDRRMSLWIPSRYGADLDFVEGEDALVVVGWEGEDRLSVAPKKWEWTQLYRVDLSPDTERVRHHGGKLEVETLDGTDARTRQRMQPIPGTLRAMDPSVSPDGQWVAYTRYRDGSSNVFISRMDGSERRALTDYTDGSWASGTDWSPDGTQVVFALHTDHQQNLWVADLATGRTEPVMRDRWEEIDPYWAPDGSLWFSADVDGVFNIFRRAQDGRIHQMTRVRTGAQSPSITPQGNLIYTHYTGFGWKSYGLRRTLFAWEEVTGRFGDPVETGHRLSVPDGPAPRPYRATRSFTGLAASPLLRLDRGFDGQVMPRVGAYLKLRDAVELNTFTANAWLGSDALLSGSWQIHRFWPDIQLSGGHWAGRRSGDEARRQVTNGGISVIFPWNEGLRFDLGLFGFRILREERGSYARVLSSRVFTAGMTAGDEAALRRSNSRRGTSARLVLSRGSSAGQARYTYNRAELFAHSVVPAAVGTDHRWVTDLSLGLTDRAVHPEDALPVGGDHPYALRPSRIQRTVAMPGYAPFVVAGEQVGVAGLAWRFPLARELQSPIGPVVVDEIYGQLGGHIGAVVQGVEAPVLGDLVAELRVSSTLFDSRWDSAVKFAWGAPVVGVPGGLRFSVSAGAGF